MTEEELARLERWRREATAGRWIWWMSEEPPFDIDVEGESVRPYIASVPRLVDVLYITEACNAVPALIAEVRKLREETSALKRQLPESCWNWRHGQCRAEG